MTPRDTEVSAYVDAFREDVKAPAEGPIDVDAAWSRFSAAVAPARPRPAKASPMVWVAAAAVLAAAAVVVWVLGSGVRLDGDEPGAGQQAPDRALGQVEHPASRKHVARPPGPEASAAEPEVSVAVPTPSPTAEAADPKPLAKRLPPQPSAPEPAAKARSSRLAEELRLLEGMRAASADGRHAEALRIVRKHAAAFEEGAFSAERELTRVRALCGLGREREARQFKARFAKRYADSHLWAQVRGICPDSTDTTNSDHGEG